VTRSIPVIFLTAIIAYPAGSPLAQWYDRIQTESDWEAFFRDGYFDYNSYQLYRELFEGDVINDTSEYLISALGNTPVEVTVPSIYSNIDLRSFQSVEAGVHGAPAIPFDFRFGKKVSADGDEGYLSLQRLSPGFETRLKLRDDSGRWRADRRSLEISDDRLRVRIGNYSPRVGCGLGIGRFDYRPVSYERGENPDRGFLFPDNSYYNGLYIDFHSDRQFLYSVKKYGNVLKNFMGGSMSVRLDGYRLGMTASGTILSSDGDRRTLGAGTVFLISDSEGLRSEVGYGESGLGFCGRLHRPKYDIRFWHYDDSFTNLQSSAPAHPDYESFTDPRYELAFRQPQRGETGLFVRRRGSLGRIDLQGALEVWKRSPDRRIALENTLRARGRIYREIYVYSSFSERRGASADRTLLEFGAGRTSESEYGILASFWISEGQIDKTKSKYFVYFSVPLKSRFQFGGRFRWNAVGEFDYFIEEKTAISGYFSIKATYRWKDSYGNDLGPLYLIVESLW
jgi:hypothetical protein